jgi:hypothetical protein
LLFQQFAALCPPLDIGCIFLDKAFFYAKGRGAAYLWDTRNASIWGTALTGFSAIRLR